MQVPISSTEEREFSEFFFRHPHIFQDHGGYERIVLGQNPLVLVTKMNFWSGITKILLLLLKYSNILKSPI